MENTLGKRFTPKWEFYFRHRDRNKEPSTNARDGVTTATVVEKAAKSEI
jgi:hypothetical protein